MGNPEFLQRRLVVQLTPVVDLSQREVRLGEIWLEPQGRIGGAPGKGEPGRGTLREVELRDVDPGESGEGEREGRVQLRGPGVHLLRRAVRLGGGTIEVVVPAEVEIVGAEILGRFCGECLVIGRLERHVERGRDLLGDPRLYLEHFLDRLVVPPGPEVTVVGHADELRGDPDPARAADPLPPHAALEDVVHPELPCRSP